MQDYQVLISGANRGIGLEFAKQYAADGWHVLACCREPESATELKALAQIYPSVRIYRLDVTNFAQIDALATELKDVNIDVLINNAGIYPNNDFGNTDYDEWARAFKINSMAPYKMVEAFLHNITRSRLKKIASLTSKMGSIDDNTSGESHAYRSSKTALNMVMKGLSIDLKPYGISAITLHPGWVQTSMGGPNALIDTQTSVSGMRSLIAALDLTTTGRFLAYNGSQINW